ncbi:MAG: hypothetical protein WC916_03240 [Candidatus Woesearchaeota archaeon]
MVYKKDEKIAILVKHLISWYEGNYCARKCYDDEERRDKHLPKLQELAKKLADIKMTHRAFLVMMRSDKTICDLSDEEWQNRKFSWKQTDCVYCKRFGLG